MGKASVPSTNIDSTEVINQQATNSFDLVSNLSEDSTDSHASQVRYTRCNKRKIDSVPFDIDEGKTKKRKTGDTVSSEKSALTRDADDDEREKNRKTVGNAGRGSKGSKKKSLTSESVHAANTFSDDDNGGREKTRKTSGLDSKGSKKRALSEETVNIESNKRRRTAKTEL